MESTILGVDIGGSHITAAMIDLDNKREIEETWARERLDSNAPADEVIEAWAVTIEKSLHGIKPTKIGMAMPGPMDYEAGISKIKDQGKYQLLYDLNIKDMLAKRLGVDRSIITFTNDAACFLMGEVFAGDFPEPEKAIGLTLGTGLGTTYIENGLPFDANLWDIPFLDGYAEEYISTRWFIKRFRELSGLEIKDVQDLIERHSDYPEFKTLFDEFSTNLGNFICDFAKRKNANAAILGGNIAHAEEYFLDKTCKLVEECLGRSFSIKKSALGEKAALLGAAVI